MRIAGATPQSTLMVVERQRLVVGESTALVGA